MGRFYFLDYIIMSAVIEKNSAEKNQKKADHEENKFSQKKNNTFRADDNKNN